jgi:hypothetical protein
MTTDLDKAREIAEKHKPYVGNIGTMLPNIARAIAEGIAYGRKQGLETARAASENAILDEIGSVNLDAEHIEEELRRRRALRGEATA